MDLDIQVETLVNGWERVPHQEEFQQLEHGFSVWASEPELTAPGGSLYFMRPSIAVIAKPQFYATGIQPFLKQFDRHRDGEQDETAFFPYLNDTALEASAYLSKFAGQMCYLSFGPNRTKNEDAGKYFENIRHQGHGSVLEHPNYSLLFWGVSRSFTHELVRHRAGFAYSQVSQRYVDGSRLRFVCRPEFQDDEDLKSEFEYRIDEAALTYAHTAERLRELMAGELEKLSRTDQRKAVNQAARACLPNETEAPIVVTGNVRAWRHFLNMRGSLFAEPEIRIVAIRTLACLALASPHLFADFQVQEDSKTGRIFLYTPHPKV